VALFAVALSLSLSLTTLITATANWFRNYNFGVGSKDEPYSMIYIRKALDGGIVID
jgi:hypothetical protein